MKIINYNSDDSVAVGVVNPKTTSLFYDKIWIPSSLIHSGIDGNKYDYIPYEIRIQEDKEALIYKEGPHKSYIHFVMENRGCMTAAGAYRMSRNRNIAILIAVMFFKKYYKINMTPFFFEYTDLEKTLFNITDEEDNSKYNDKIDVIRFTTNNMATIIEESLSWEQVLEFRNDELSRKKLNKFRNWGNYNLKGKSIAEISEILNQSYSDYCYALKKHGVKTKIGSFTTVLTTASTIIDIINSGTIDSIAMGVALSASLITYTSNAIIDYMDYKNSKDPIAYIYDIIKESEKIKR